MCQKKACRCTNATRNHGELGEIVRRILGGNSIAAMRSVCPFPNYQVRVGCSNLARMGFLLAASAIPYNSPQGLVGF